MVGHAVLVSENCADSIQGAREQPLMSCLQMLSSFVWSLVLRRAQVLRAERISGDTGGSSAQSVQTGVHKGSWVLALRVQRA